MSSAFSWLLIGLVLPISAANLRVCADPNNLPYSNIREQGFENDLARMVAHDLNRTLTYTWAPQRGRYIENGLNAGHCDVIMGVASAVDEVSTTRPYYRSSYVFIARAGHASTIRSFDDAALKTARIGVHVLQHEDATVPPAQVLINHGLTPNIVWFKLYPDFDRQNPPAALIEAVEHRNVDVAIVWGPLGGYFALHSPVPLVVVPVPNQMEHSTPLAFDISMGVRHRDRALLAQLNSEIERRQTEIRRLLQRFGVPVVR